MIVDSIFWLGNRTCGALGAEANTYCMNSQDVMLLGLMMVFLSVVASAVPFVLLRR
jgi:hypothetical protein